MMNALTIADLAVSQDLDRNALATITGAGYYVHLTTATRTAATAATTTAHGWAGT